MEENKQKVYSGKVKKFRDTIHGYIEIPEEIVESIIDTELFQRLRYIEQTSMRPLYPAARHDRFIHSLGVYWLGKQVFIYFRQNAQKVLQDAEVKIEEEWWDKQEILFWFGCLLHDCAHAPFSHTLEALYMLRKYKIKKQEYNEYGWNKDTRIAELDFNLIKLCKNKDKDFINDFFADTKNSLEYKGIGAPHEKMSSYCALKEFEQAIPKTVAQMTNGKITLEPDDLVFIVRMIIGCTYGNTKENYNSIKNCIISMLNSTSIDVDGLDYIVRDAYMSGIDNFSIDYHRLLGSFTIIPIDVYDNKEVLNENIDGIWLKDSRFFFEKMVSEGEFEGKMIFEGLEKEDSIRSINESVQRNGQTYRSNLDSNLIIKVGNGVLKLEEACKIKDSSFYGRVSGKKLVDRKTVSADQDIHREYVLGYEKNSLSIIQSTVDARNQEYMWVYTHPKVLYSSNYLQWELLRDSAKYLCCCNNNRDFQKEKLDFHKCENCSCNKRGTNASEEDFILYILGFETYFDKDFKQYAKLRKEGFIFYRSCDDDLNALFKRIYKENEQRGNLKSEKLASDYKEFFTRQHKKPLWKSFVEYDNFIKKYDKNKTFTLLCKNTVRQSSLYRNSYGEISGEEQSIFDRYGIEKVLIIKAGMKTKQLSPYSTFIKFKDQTIRLADIFDKSVIKEKWSKDFYYLYAQMDKELSEEDIKKLEGELKENSKKRIGNTTI